MLTEAMVWSVGNFGGFADSAGPQGEPPCSNLLQFSGQP